MPVIGKQRRANRSRTFRTRRDRFAASSKPKAFSLSGKLKSNNNLLAKALSDQKQETQLLFIEKIELTRQVQALTAACNKRDLVFTNVQKNAKEMLSMLVTMTNFVTNTIVCCQEFAQKPDINTLRPRSGSITKRESTRRLSTKSPTKGVVKPMVSGHTITKPTINLRRVNMRRINNVLDLSDIVESSPDRINNTTIDTNHMHTASAFTSANRLGYDGERRRRLPERIPVNYVQENDEERESLDRQEPRLSTARISGRLSNVSLRKRSGNSLLSQIRSPSVSLCDVSKLLQNSQTINVRMLEDSQANGDSSRLSNTLQNISQPINGENILDINITLQESEEASKNQTMTKLQPSPTSEHIEWKKSTKTQNRTIDDSEIDPMEGPSWLLNGISVNPSMQEENKEEEEERTGEIFRRKHIRRKLDSLESEDEPTNNVANDSMEFTECVGAIRKPPQILMHDLVNNQIGSDQPTPVMQNTRIEQNFSNEKDADNLSNQSFQDLDTRATSSYMNRSSEFVTARRGQYISDDDDEDDDTIMLKLSRGRKPTKPGKFDINDLRLPVVNCPIMAPAERSDSEPEVTTTIQIIPQTYMPLNLPEDTSVRDRASNFCSLQLPRIDDELIKTKYIKRSVKRKKPKSTVKFYDSDCSDTDCEIKSKKKSTKSYKQTDKKDPSSAKVVLEKLNDTRIKTKSVTPERNIVDQTPDPDATSERTSDASISVTDSNSSTHSVSDKNSRPRRQKAPTNLKEPSVKDKMRR